MPAPGDQHRQQAAAANPFEEQVQRISEFTAKEIATLASRLDKQLGPEYISTRPGAGGQRVHYLAAEKVINLANEVFGFNGWSSQIKNVQVDFCDEHAQSGRIDVGLAIIVRVTLKDGTYHEDMGYGHIENCKGKAAAFEKARKEAATDALKRTLRTFGNVLGNCLYDKEYLSKVTKVKANPTSKWDPENLHRHADYAPVKSEPLLSVAKPAVSASSRPVPKFEPSNSTVSADGEDEFGGNLFDEVELAESHSDGVILPGYSNDGHAAAQSNGQMAAPPQRQNSVQQSRPPNANRISTSVTRPHSTPPNNAISGDSADPNFEPPVGFVTGRAADALTGDRPPPQSLGSLQRFNPTAESPSIRKTAGVAHNASKPVTRTMLTGGGSDAAVPAHQQTAQPRHFVNPAADSARRIGMPPQSPMGGRGATGHSSGSYRPPGPANAGGAAANSMVAGAAAATAGGIKRPASRGPAASHANTPDRAPLADVSNVAVSAPASGGGSAAMTATSSGEGAAKRARVVSGGGGGGGASGGGNGTNTTTGA